MSLLPYAVLVLSLIMTLFFWQLFDRGLKTRAELIYKDKTEEISSRFVKRLHENEQVLLGATGLFNASDDVTRDEWRNYFAALKLNEDSRGIQGMGFAQWIPADEKEAHVKAIRAHGFPYYTIRPEGERPEYTSIIYLEPFDWRNQRAFGYDMFSEPVRRKAMANARDSGETSITAKIILVQETDKDRQNGFLMYVPVFQSGRPVDTIDERRNALLGFVYSPIRASDFLYATLGKMPDDIALDIYTSETPQPENLLVSSIVSEKKKLPDGYTPDFRSEQKIEIFGQTLLFSFSSLPLFKGELLRWQSYAALAGGVLVSFLLTMIAFMQRTARDKALSVALALKESQDRLGFHVDNSPMATVEWDANFIVTRWAGEAERVFGWPPEETIGRPIMDLNMIYEDDIPIVQETIRKLKDASQKYVVTCNRNYTKDHRIITCEWYNTVLVNDQGVMLSVLSQVLDISERKQSELYRDIAHNVLQILNEPGNLDELFPRVIASLKGHTGFDAVGIRLQQNDDYPFIASEGFPVEFLLKENSLVERSANGGICRDEQGNVNLECTCGLVIAGKTDPSNPLFTKGGSCWTNNSFPLLETLPEADPRLHPRNECIHQGFASVALIPIRDAGKIVGLIQFNDRRNDCFTLSMIERMEEIATYIGAVLMRKRIEEEKNSLQFQMLQAQKLESLGVLAGGVAHDFNNILTSIIGNAELALMRLNPESLATENLQQIASSSERAADLARQMLAYSGKGRFVVENIDLNRLINEMLQMLQVSISKNIQIKLNLQSPLPEVNVDATQIRQLIMNLVINSSEAIGSDVGVIDISTGSVIYDKKYQRAGWLDDTLREGMYAFLEVSDSGCGMDKETQSKIFEPFFTTKFTGRGLGLSAVQGIVKGHKGAIHVYSEAGKGSRFKVLLPVSEIQHQIFDEETTDDCWKGEGKVLLIDDEVNVRTIGVALLQELGFTTITASDGQEGISVFSQNTDIILVILDLTMPKMDGEQCFVELKKLKSDVKVIMSSGYNEQEVMQKFTGTSMSGFIQKPYRLSALRDTIRKVMSTS